MPRKPTGTLFYRICKRTFDIAFSAGCTAVLAIPMACVCAAICAESPGCPVYTQERVGRGGRVIRVLKLRSMVSDAGDVQKYLSPEQLHQWELERKVDNDPRITKVGQFIRKCSIDEFLLLRAVRSPAAGGGVLVTPCRCRAILFSSSLYHLLIGRATRIGPSRAAGKNFICVEQAGMSEVDIPVFCVIGRPAGTVWQSKKETQK